MRSEMKGVIGDDKEDLDDELHGDNLGWGIPLNPTGSGAAMLQTHSNSQDFRVGVDTAPKPGAPYRIPFQLFLTSKFPSLQAAPSHVRDNVQHIIDMNAGIKVTWFDDQACAAFLEKNNGKLHRAFLNSKHGPFKSDICRTAYLGTKGGWYVDLDVDLRQPFVELAGPETAFASIFSASRSSGSASVLNAFIGAAPDSLVMHKAVTALEAVAMDGCANGTQLTCGTWALEQGLRQAYTSCGQPVPTRADAATEPVCCGQPARMMIEVDMANPIQRASVKRYDKDLIERAIEGRQVAHFRGARNMYHHFKGLDFALLGVGKKPFVAGYSRFDKCTWWGCDQNPNKNDLAQPPAVRAAPDGSLWTEHEYTDQRSKHPASWPRFWAELPSDDDGTLGQKYVAQMQARTQAKA